MTTNPICHKCGSDMIRDVRPVNLSYKSESYTVELPGWYCTKCGEGLHSLQDLESSDRALCEAKQRLGEV